MVIRHHGEPAVVTRDNRGASTAALSTLNAGRPEEETITIRQSKYLNNLVVQDHRNIRRQIKLMTGFKSFRRAQTLLAGIGLIHLSRKGQYRTPHGDSSSQAEQFYRLAMKKISRSYGNQPTLMWQSLYCAGRISEAGWLKGCTGR
ncbi:DDE domain-containing protein [Izhakiella capsodis]|uniref:DDE domain-containing protein n=1 Tax=Izhakiella capsodis TaxID=1367852 RepID=A0A1I5A102_9GAMM|nr:DDE domain-containing protein [Izhakiella capsodis]